MVAEVDVQRGAVDHVFGREHHNFDETTITGRIMFRTHPRGPLHVLAGGGLAVQRAHAQFEVPPLARVNRVEWLRLWHGRAGVDCDVTPRLTIRTHGSLSMGGGLDWILGGGVCLGYRF
jgi:hypothetical protein